jgi:hypothetical protein
MRSHRFGRKIKLPATIAIKRQIIMLMALDETKKAEAQLVEQCSHDNELVGSSVILIWIHSTYMKPIPVHLKRCV